MYKIHPHNKLGLLFKKLPNEIIVYTSSFLKITERLSHLPNHLEQDIISCLNECRDDTTKYASSYPIYYDNMVFKKISWNRHKNHIMEYNTNNKIFSTTIGIDHSSNPDQNLIYDRCMYIRFMFHDTLLYMGKKRKVHLRNTINKFQDRGFSIEEDALYFPICNYVYISKIIPIQYTDNININIEKKSIKTCMKILLEIHDKIYQIFFSN
jgi:hypothetical protein